MLHPARTLPYAQLAEELDKRVAAGILGRGQQGPLRIYIYSNRCVYERLWDPFSLMARGLVLDQEAQVVRATPFPKFFNYGEGEQTFPAETFEVYEKLDGSLGIVFHDGQRWRVVTKGSFDSPQARWAENWLTSKNLDALNPGDTYLFEIIFPENRIVVRYDFADLVLLSAFHGHGHEYSRNEVLDCGERLGSRVVGARSYASFRELVTACEEMDAQQEGFVVRFSSGLRLKIKGAAYRRVHSLLSNTTPLGLWRAMEAGDNLEKMRQEIPEEFWTDFDKIAALLHQRMTRVRERVEKTHEEWADRSDREVGLALSTLDPGVRRYIFGRRKLGPDWIHDKTLRSTVLREIRPDGNRLEGYDASTFLLGVMEEE